MSGTWNGSASAGRRLTQGIDDGATDEQWTLGSSDDGYCRIGSVRNSDLCTTAAAADGSVELRAAIDASSGPAADARPWRSVREAPPMEAPFSLEGGHTGRCLDVPGAGKGVQAQIYDGAGNRNQRITQTAAGELRVRGKRLVEYAGGATPGTRTILWNCNGTAGPKWSFRVDWAIDDRSDGLAVDVTDRGTAYGSPVRLWTAPGNADQSWSRG